MMKEMRQARAPTRHCLELISAGPKSAEYTSVHRTKQEPQRLRHLSKYCGRTSNNRVASSASHLHPSLRLWVEYSRRGMIRDRYFIFTSWVFGAIEPDRLSPSDRPQFFKTYRLMIQ